MKGHHRILKLLHLGHGQFLAGRHLPRPAHRRAPIGQDLHLHAVEAALHPPQLPGPFVQNHADAVVRQVAEQRVQFAEQLGGPDVIAGLGQRAGLLQHRRVARVLGEQFLGRGGDGLEMQHHVGVDRSLAEGELAGVARRAAEHAGLRALEPAHRRQLGREIEAAVPDQQITRIKRRGELMLARDEVCERVLHLAGDLVEHRLGEGQALLGENGLAEFELHAHEGLDVGEQLLDAVRQRDHEGERVFREVAGDLMGADKIGEFALKLAVNDQVVRVREHAAHRLQRLGGGQQGPDLSCQPGVHLIPV